MLALATSVSLVLEKKDLILDISPQLDIYDALYSEIMYSTHFQHSIVDKR